MRMNIVLAGLLAIFQAVDVKAEDPAYVSAVRQLRAATFPDRQGQHNLLLGALRNLRDPALKPLFSHLVGTSEPSLKIHGVLGLGEIDSKSKIDLTLLMNMTHAPTQAQLISAAIDSELITDEQLQQVVKSPGIETPVKIIAAAKLVKEGKLKDQKVIANGLKSERLALKGLAAVLKAQLGDKSSLKILDEISTAKGLERDPARLLILRSSINYDFGAIANWAVGLADEKGIHKGIKMTALRAGLHFKQASALAAWKKTFAEVTSVADKTRYAIVLAGAAKKVSAGAFDTLIASKIEVVQQIGRVGRLISSGQKVDKEAMKLLEFNNVLASRWILQHTLQLPIEKSADMLVAIILAAEAGKNEVRFRSHRVENAVLSSQRLIEKSKQAPLILPDLIKGAPPLTRQAILIGLIRAEVKQPHAMIKSLKFDKEINQTLSLLLRTREGIKPSEDELSRLALIVRRGPGLQTSLRVQAAWIYLKAVAKNQMALTDALKKG